MPDSSHKVLLVDDDPAILRLLESKLTRAGYRVRTAEDGITALRLIDEECPAFVITDWIMPGVSGPELCKAIRALDLRNYIYLIMLTGKSSSEDLIAALESGADDFINKPLSLEVLLARLHAGSRVIELERRLKHVAQTDPLTGVLTRRAFFEQFEREISRARRYDLPLSAVMLDIDYFKKINDTHGHAMGDRVLRELSQYLQKNCRASDYICRYGGEEFCILLTETSENAGTVWCERTREAISRMEIELADQQSLRFNITLGIAQMRQDVSTPDQLVDLADQALLVGKQSGRDRVVRYTSLDEAAHISLPGSQRDPFEGVPARCLMTSLMTCLNESETVGQAADFFLRFRITSAPVIDLQGKLVGILSEKDVMTVMMQTESWAKPIREIMQRNVVFYEEETPVKSIYNFLCRVTLRRVVIVRDGWPTGIISRGSFLRWHANWLAVERGLTDCGNLGDSKDAVRQTSQAIAKHAARLSELVDQDDVDFLPALVDGATRLQEYVSELLSDSHNHLGQRGEAGRESDSPNDGTAIGIEALLSGYDADTNS